MRIITAGTKTTKSTVKKVNVVLPKKHYLLLEKDALDNSFEAYGKLTKVLARICNQINLTEEPFGSVDITDFKSVGAVDKDIIFEFSVYIGHRKKPFKLTFAKVDCVNDVVSHFSSKTWDEVFNLKAEEKEL